MNDPRRVCNLVAVLTTVVLWPFAANSIDAAGALDPTADNWTTFGNGPTHSGFYPATIGNVPITAGWAKDFPTGINQVAIADGCVFVTSSGAGWVGGPEMFAAAFNAETGNEIWSQTFQYPPTMSSPTIFNGHVFFHIKQSSTYSHVLGLRVATGQQSRDINIETQGYNKMPPTIFGDGLFVRGGYFGGMKGYTLSNGGLRFETYLDQYDDWTPTFDGTTLYNCISGVFKANNPRTGAELWQLNFQQPGEILIFAGQTVVANNKASVISFGFVGPDVGNSFSLVTLDLSTGSVAWRGANGIDPQTGYTVGYSGIPASDGEKVYAIYNASSVRALDAQTGQILGSYEIGPQGAYPAFSQPLVTNDLVIVSRVGFGIPGSTYVFDKATYTLRTVLPRGGELSFAGDVLYVAGSLNASPEYGGTALLATYRFRNGTAPPPLAPLRNLSTRLNIGVAEEVGVGGFILTGTSPDKVMIRAIGPSLMDSGVTGALADPVLELHDGSTGAIIASNDNWQTTQIGGIIGVDQREDIQASTLAPTNPRESVIVATLQPGAYTAVTRGANLGTGTGLIEIYDLNASVWSRLANISTRGFVGNGGTMIAGFIVGYQNTRIIARTIGPSVWLGAPQLPDPTLELHDGNGTVVAFNDNWRDTQQDEILATTIPPANDLESAIVQTLAPGPYTAILRRGNATMSGLALVEVYNLQ